ncbi:MAG: hypothetical protein HY286_09665 [Planctomycetes bacterium]|nr:hypothetical protein [Planctomycetota bacterium]
MAGKRNRRTYDEIIAALKHKVAQLEERKRLKSLKDDPAVKLGMKLGRALRTAENEFTKANRADLANAAKAAYISIEGNLRSHAKS